MNTFTLTINTDTFEDDDLAFEIARILRKLADTVERELLASEGFSVTLRDVNGNKVGEAEA